MPLKTHVLIIGGGIAGTSIARELSKFDIDVILAEKEADVGWGQTKLSYAIRHPGVRWKSESIAQKFIAESNHIFDRLIEELDIDFKKCGEIVLAFNENERKCLATMKNRGEKLNLQGLEILERSEIRHLEPKVSPHATHALLMPLAGVFNHFDLTHAFYENALTNGVHMWTGTEVLGILPQQRGFVVETDREVIEANFIVNAAGLYAQQIAQMAQTDNFKIEYNTKASCFVLDRSVGDTVKTIVTGFMDLSNFNRFKAVIPTYGGNLLLYTSISEPAGGMNDHSLEKRSLAMTCQSVEALIPGFDFQRHVISAFSGVTARNDRGDFIVEASPKNQRFIQAVLPPPGITCSPVVALKVAELLKKSGLVLKKRTDFSPNRKRIRSMRNAPAERIDRWVRKDERFGRIVCRCEKVTEGEIAEAIGRGASTLDGVKFRTRAGMGTCQGNFCTAPLIALMARENGCPVDEITKKGRGSRFVTQKKAKGPCR